MSVPRVPKLSEHLSPNIFRIGVAKRRSLEEELSLTTVELMRLLVSEAQKHAIVPISGFRVGAVGRTADGELFLGFNLEFRKAGFAQTVHAEQFLISWARSCSESPLVSIAVSAPPCGHCRQFVCEFDPKGQLELHIGEEPPLKLERLLPRAFTPEDLQVFVPFWNGVVSDGLGGAAEAEEFARAAARTAYVPYSRSPAGVVARFKGGRLFAGAAIENAAYNPGLPPLQAAIVRAIASVARLQDIESVVLCQEATGGVNYEPQTWDLCRALGLTEDRFHTIGL